MFSQAPIELILIQQQHRAMADAQEFNLERYAKDLEMKETIYSQFKIMQILPSLSSYAAILVEGNYQGDCTPSDVQVAARDKLRRIFPNYKNLSEMDFNALSWDQMKVIWENEGVKLLFYLELISHLYKTANIRVTPAFMNQYRETTEKIFPKYASKLLNEVKDPGLFRKYRMPSEKKYYAEIQAELAEANPRMFRDREKEALDFSLLAAQKSGKKLVVLIFGENHLDGILKLINTDYKDRIVLKEVINSKDGFSNTLRQKHLDKLSSEGLAAYKEKKYELAAEHYKDLVTFWRATPKSTPKKNISLMSAEFNLGSSLFKRAEVSGTTYTDALRHLEQAKILNDESSNKNKKYFDRYQEAFKRNTLISIFNEAQWKTPVKIMIEYANSDESSVNKNSMTKSQN